MNKFWVVICVESLKLGQDGTETNQPGNIFVEDIAYTNSEAAAERAAILRSAHLGEYRAVVVAEAKTMITNSKMDYSTTLLI